MAENHDSVSGFPHFFGMQATAGPVVSDGSQHPRRRSLCPIAKGTFGDNVEELEPLALR